MKGKHLFGICSSALLLAGCWADGEETGSVAVAKDATAIASTRSAASLSPAAATDDYVPFDQTNYDYRFPGVARETAVMPGNLGVGKGGNRLPGAETSDQAYLHYHGSSGDMFVGDYEFGTSFGMQDVVRMDADGVTYRNMVSGVPRTLEIYIPLIKGRRPLYVRPWMDVDYVQRGCCGARYLQKLLSYGASGKKMGQNAEFRGSPVYDIRLFGSVDFQDYDFAASSGVMTVNPASGAVKFRAELIGAPVAGGSPTWVGSIETDGLVRSLEGRFDASAMQDDWFSLDLNAAGSGNPITAIEVRGMFFGPNGQEIGGSLAIVDADRKLKLLSFAGIQR